MTPRMRYTGYAPAFLLVLAMVLVPSRAVHCQQDTGILEESVTIASYDGTQLATKVVRPDSDGAFPVLLYRTPYGMSWMEKRARDYAKSGIVCILQDTRGRFDSGGSFEPFVHGVRDGDATAEWIRNQPWCNGVIGGTGHSYVGFTALYLLAGEDEPPASIVVSHPVASPRGGLYRGGAMNHHFDYYWSLLVDGKGLDLDYIVALDWDTLFGLLPLETAHRGVDRELPYYREWLAWANGSFGKGKLPEINDIHAGSTASLLVAGWFDLFCPDVIDTWTYLRENGGGTPTKLIIGPFDHGLSPPPESDMEFGDWNTLNIGSIQNRWNDRWLLGERNGVEDIPDVQYFLLGENRWVASDTWPPEGVELRDFYIHGYGDARSLDGDGRLNEREQFDEPTDRFVYDPADPVPTLGGAICCLRDMTKAGPMDQRDVEKRKDVLVYTTDVLEEDLTIAGPVALELYAASSARDTDFTGKLVDVHPDGTALNIAEGIVRARFRKGIGAPEFLEPWKVERYNINMGHIAMTFLKGHRIRLEVSSSNFPRYDRNLNTGGPIGQEDTWVTAQQAVLHDNFHKSRLILPVLTGR